MTFFVDFLLKSPGRCCVCGSVSTRDHCSGLRQAAELVTALNTKVQELQCELDDANDRVDASESTLRSTMEWYRETLSKIAHPICVQEGGVCKSLDAWQISSCNAARGALAKVRP